MCMWRKCAARRNVAPARERHMARGATMRAIGIGSAGAAIWQTGRGCEHVHVEHMEAWDGGMWMASPQTGASVKASSGALGVGR